MSFDITRQIAARDLLSRVERGEFPKMLYKFRGIDRPDVVLGRCEQLLKTRALYFPSPLEFNDPFDGQLKFRVDQSAKGIHDFIKQSTPPPGTIKNRAARRKKAIEFVRQPKAWEQRIGDLHREQIALIGLCSLSKNWDNILQWSYYGYGHRGIALGFDVTADPDYFLLPFEVSYEESYPSLQFPADDMHIIQALLSVKAKLWKHEAEVRIYRDRKGPYGFKPEMLKEITFGVNCSKDDVLRVKNWCATLGHVAFYRARTANSTFTLLRDQL